MNRITRGTLDIEQATRILYGLNDKDFDSSFLNAEKQQEASEENALTRGKQAGVEYTTFGNLRRIKF